MTTEDDAFIRKIVDSPGDDLPRLVYADWLDERDDPRGAYLRAELEWAKPWRDGNRPGDASAVRRLGAGLDAVWVARVSRPPVGVCWDAVKVFAEGVPATAEDLAIAASDLKMKFSSELVGLLLNYNLGQVRYRFACPAMKRAVALQIEGFVCLIDPEYDDGHISLELVDRTWCEYDEGLPEKYVFFAATGYDSYFVVSPRGKIHRVDTAYLHQGERRGITTIAPSVGSFLSILEPATLH